jgi:2-polyprenyl-6-hydroxyphenyl methylase/3-demethylubiquinone-9 3-methyltransferase
MSGFFSQFASSWANPQGPMMFLHQMNSARIQFILECLNHKKGLVGLDVGCGIGQVTKLLLDAGYAMDCLEQEEELVKQAKELLKDHVENVRFYCEEALSFEPIERYDFIVCLEMLEHVDNPIALCKKMQTWLNPGGIIIVSTINRTNIAYFSAIFGAEYLFNILPKGTHEFDHFITPQEMNMAMEPLICKTIKGLIYNPFEKKFFIGQSLCINYIGCWSDESER